MQAVSLVLSWNDIGKLVVCDANFWDLLVTWHSLPTAISKLFKSSFLGSKAEAFRDGVRNIVVRLQRMWVQLCTTSTTQSMTCVDLYISWLRVLLALLWMFILRNHMGPNNQLHRFEIDRPSIVTVWPFYLYSLTSKTPSRQISWTSANTKSSQKWGDEAVNSGFLLHWLTCRFDALRASGFGSKWSTATRAAADRPISRVRPLKLRSSSASCLWLLR